MAKKKVSEKALRHYTKYYPEYTKASVKKTLQEILQRHGKLDAITVDHWIKERRFGGLGKGRRKKAHR